MKQIKQKEKEYRRPNSNLTDNDPPPLLYDFKISKHTEHSTNTMDIIRRACYSSSGTRDLFTPERTSQLSLFEHQFKRHHPPPHPPPHPPLRQQQKQQPGKKIGAKSRSQSCMSLSSPEMLGVYFDLKIVL